MPGRRWARCCFREAWPFRGAPPGTERLVLLGRRFVSKLDWEGDWLEDGAWVAVGGAEGGLPREEEVEVIMRSRKAGEGEAKLRAAGAQIDIKSERT